MLLLLERTSVAAVEAEYGPSVARSTARILEARRRMAECAAAALADIGDELAAVKSALPHGRWLTWLADHAGYTPRTAANIMSVAELRRRNEKTFSNLSDLAASKLYRLAQVNPKKTVGMTPATKLPVGPKGPSKSIGEMTAREADRALDLLDRRARAKLPAGDRESFAKSFIESVESLTHEAPTIRALKGKLSGKTKADAERAVESLRKSVLQWPAWAMRP